jgi:hypothetical protein
LLALLLEAACFLGRFGNGLWTVRFHQSVWRFPSPLMQFGVGAALGLYALATAGGIRGDIVLLSMSPFFH